MQLSAAERDDGRVECNLHPKIDEEMFLVSFELVEIVIKRKDQIWSKYSSVIRKEKTDRRKQYRNRRSSA